jgi:hypothetical protein
LLHLEALQALHNDLAAGHASSIIGVSLDRYSGIMKNNNANFGNDLESVALEAAQHSIFPKGTSFGLAHSLEPCQRLTELESDLSSRLGVKQG